MLQFNGEKIEGIIKLGPDSFHVPKFVQTYLKSDPQRYYEAFANNHQWNDRNDPDTRYRGHSLPRDKMYFVQSDEGDQVANYRFPAWQNAIVRTYQDFEALPEVNQIINELTAKLTYNGQPVSINHAIATRYRDGNDTITWHSDKEKDIREGSPILSLSFGATRIFRLGKPNNKKTVTVKHSIHLESGDLFVLGPLTNKEYQHDVPKTKKDEEEVGQRISLVMRDIKSKIKRSDAAKKAKKRQAPTKNTSKKKVVKKRQRRGDSQDDE